MFHHVLGSCRPEDLKRSLALRRGNFQPASEPEIGNTHDMIRMQVGDEEPIDRSQLDAGLNQAHGDATPTIDEQRLAACLHQNTWAKSVDRRLRAAGAEQGHSKVVAVKHALRPRANGHNQSKETGD